MMKRNSVVNKPIVLTTIKDEHLISLDALCIRLNTHLCRGMLDRVAKNILRSIGKNQFNRPKKLFSIDFTGLLGTSKQRFSKLEWKRLFGQQIPDTVTVIRDGQKKQICGKYLVIGDIIELNENDIVPADVRIFTSSDNVIVDNRLITGNLENRNHRADEILYDVLLTPNMLFACTRVLRGTCKGIVLRTGEDTVFGMLKNFATKVKVEKAGRRKHSLE